MKQITYKKYREISKKIYINAPKFWRDDSFRKHAGKRNDNLEFKDCCFVNEVLLTASKIIEQEERRGYLIDKAYGWVEERHLVVRNWLYYMTRSKNGHGAVFYILEREFNKL